MLNIVHIFNPLELVRTECFRMGKKAFRLVLAAKNYVQIYCTRRTVDVDVPSMILMSTAKLLICNEF